MLSVNDSTCRSAVRAGGGDKRVMTAQDDVIVVDGIHKAYGAKVAVEDVSFTVRRNEIFGIIGPNGAGKTTTVESIVGLRSPDRGTIRVLGLDPNRDGNRLRERLGVQLQEADLPERMLVRDACRLFSAFYDRTVPWEPLLERWGIADRRDAAFGKLSGGQKQRLFVTLALLNDPDVVILDELSAGLDPQARRNSWDLVRAVRDSGKTVIMVSHFMDEAEALCDRVAVIDRGRVAAMDTPANLRQSVSGRPRVAFTAPPRFDPSPLRRRAGVTSVMQEGNRIVVDGDGFLMAEVADALREQNLAPADLRTEQASLEDVFLKMTSHDGPDAPQPTEEERPNG